MNNIPNDYVAPLQEVLYRIGKKSRGNFNFITHRNLLIGDVNNSIQMIEEKPVVVQSLEEVEIKFGRKSILYEQAFQMMKTSSNTIVEILPLNKISTGTVATGSIMFTGTATSANFLKIYISSAKSINVFINVGETADAIAVKVKDAITNNSDVYFSATIDTTATSKINLTSINKGAHYNDIFLNISYTDEDMANLPSGVSFSIIKFSEGTGELDLSSVNANNLTRWYTGIAIPFESADILSAIETLYIEKTGLGTELDNQVAYEPFVGVIGYKADYLAYLTKLKTQAYNYLSVHPVSDFKATKLNTWEIAAKHLAIISEISNADPSEPLTGVLIENVDVIGDKISYKKRKNIFEAGGGYWEINDIGNLLLGASRCSYTENPINGSSDRRFSNTKNSYLLMNIKNTVQQLRDSPEFQRNNIVKNLNDVKQSRNPNRVSPEIINASIQNLMKKFLDLGWIVELENSQKSVEVVINNNNQIIISYETQFPEDLNVWGIIHNLYID